MSSTQLYITMVVLMAGTMITRFMPFVLFKSEEDMPDFIKYLGDVLPPAVFAMLVVYCLKGVTLFSGNHGIPDLLAVGITRLVHLKKKNTLLSIAVGTVRYMILIRLM